jgi:hypothetical protein
MRCIVHRDNLMNECTKTVYKRLIIKYVLYDFKFNSKYNSILYNQVEIGNTGNFAILFICT